MCTIEQNTMKTVFCYTAAILAPFAALHATATPAADEALLQAAKNYNLVALKTALSNGADPNYCKAAALEQCIAYGSADNPQQAEMVATLLQAGANPNLRAAEIAYAAGCSRDIATLKLLFAHGLDIRGIFPDKLPLEYLWLNEEEFPKPLFELFVQNGAQVAPEQLLFISAGKEMNRMEGEKEIRRLVELGADVNIRDEKGRTPLMIATERYLNTNRAGTGVIRALLQAGADVNARDTEGNTPLLWLAAHYCECCELYPPQPLMQLLIEARADVQARNKEGLNAAELACCHPYPSAELISWLQAKGLPLCKNAEMVLAASHNNTQQVEKLLREGADPNYNRAVALACCMGIATQGQKGTEERTTRLLLKYGANPNLRAHELMFRAIHISAFDILEQYLQNGLDVKQAGADTTGMLGDTYIRNKEMFNMLVCRGMDINSYIPWYGSLLHIALKKSPEDIEHLLALGVDAATRNSRGQTPLEQAKATGKPPHVIQALEMAEHILMKKRLLANKSDAEGITPLMRAVANPRNGAIEIFKLLRQGADVHARDKEGRTALFFFSPYDEQQAEKARLLIAAGADVNARDKQNNTPLLCLPPMRHNGEPRVSCAPTIELLVQAGADFRVLDKEGRNLAERLATNADEQWDGPAWQLLHRLGLTVRPDYGLLTPGTDKLPELLAQGANPNFMQARSLIMCLGHPTGGATQAERMRLLLEAGANPNLCAETLVQRLCILREHEVLELLFRHGMRLPQDKQLLADCLCFTWGQEAGLPKPTFDLLVKYGADINSICQTCGTPLLSLVSLYQQSREEMLYLMQLGINPHLKDEEGKTATEHAREQNRTDLIPLLEEYTQKYGKK